MIKSYFKTAIRNFKRHSGYTIINIAGLTCGLTAVIFIFLWVRDELRFDSFHSNGETLYKVWHNSLYTDGTIKTFPTTPATLSLAAKDQIPEVKFAARTDWGSELLLNANEKSFMQGGIWADPEFFSMFTFPITKGNPSKPLPDNNSIAISERLASVYFEDKDPIGKTFTVSEDLEVKVTAVFENVPAFSSMQFDFVLPFETYLQGRPWMANNWEISGIQTFIQLSHGASIDEVNEKLTALVKKNCAACLVNPFLQLYKDVHLYSNFTGGKQDGGAIEYVRAFSLIALFILAMACINFMNLATARSSTRSREVGIRKVIGAQRKGLVMQFLGESLLLSLLSMTIALAVVQLTLPIFNTVTAKSITLTFEPLIALAFISIAIITGVIAGSYPAFFLSSFKPVVVLKGRSQKGTGETWIRKGLVVFQFGLAVILMTGSIVVYNQVEFIRKKNLGLNRENVLTVALRGGVQKNLGAFKSEAMRIPGVLGVSAGSDLPFDVQNTTADPVWPGMEKDEVIPFKVIMSDEDLISTLGMTVIDGRAFDSELPMDSSNYIINEAAAKAMRLDDPVGTPLDMWFGKGKIIGVVKDFHNQNFRSAIDPLIMTYAPSNAWGLFIKLDGANLERSLQELEKVYKKFDQVYPFTFSFLDEQFNSQYQNVITTGKLTTAFTLIGIFVSCLGLFGLASFTAERRTKELGIRKILGATVSNLVTLLCSDFLKLVFIALAIATPLAYFLGESFLNQYAFRVEMSIWMFVAVASGIIGLAVVTVIFQSLKAAITNPTHSLRSE